MSRAVNAALVAQRLTAAGTALRDLLALLPPEFHRLAVDLAHAGAACEPSADDIADSAAMLMRFRIAQVQRRRVRQAAVLRIVTPQRGEA